jgi:hypothetical protein
VAEEEGVAAGVEVDGVPVGAEVTAGKPLPVVGTTEEEPPLPVAGEVKEVPDVVIELCGPVAEEEPEPSVCETEVVRGSAAVVCPDNPGDAHPAIDKSDITSTTAITAAVLAVSL